MELREDDYGYDINFTVYEEDGTTIKDLSDVDEILFLVRDNNTKRNIVEGTCEVVDAEEGTCKYVVAVGDFFKNGCFDAGLQLVWDSSIKKETSMNFSLIVSDSLK